MQKFQFSLQKLLNYKEQVFDVERGILTEMNARLNELLAELEAMRAELRRSGDELTRKYAEGITSLEIARHKTYLAAVGDDIVLKEQEIALQRQAIDRQTDKVREAKIEISTMEKLKEKKLEEYTYLENKMQEQFIEEYVSTQKAMSLTN